VPFASLPDLASPGFPAAMSVAAGFIGTTHAFARRMPRDEVRWQAFLMAYAGAGVGLLAYVIALLLQLY
jgi:hypothetical protein